MALAHPYPLTVDQFLAIPGLPERTELIEGVIYEMAPEGPPHAGPQAMLLRALWVALPDLTVWAGGSIRVTEDFCPIPDVALYPAGFGPDGYPSAQDVLLVVEVGVSTRRTDREIKAPAYASGGVPELWLVAPEASSLTLYSDPQDGRYETMVLLSWPEDLDTAVERLVSRLAALGEDDV